MHNKTKIKWLLVLTFCFSVSLISIVSVFSGVFFYAQEKIKYCVPSKGDLFQLWDTPLKIFYFFFLLAFFSGEGILSVPSKGYLRARKDKIFRSKKGYAHHSICFIFIFMVIQLLRKFIIYYLQSK